MKKQKLYTIGLCLVFLIGGCKNVPSNNEDKDSGANPNIEVKTNFQENSIPIGYKNLKLVNDIKKDIKNSDDTECEAWDFDKKSLEGLLETMRQVDGQESYKLCYQYPCWYKGIVSNDISEYVITIYGGGNITLYNDNEELHFIIEKESNLFIAVCDCCEDE